MNSQFEKGTSTIPDNALIIIDGRELTQEDLKKIKPEQIASFSILKGETAIKMYGEKGKNSVILVETKKK